MNKMFKKIFAVVAACATVATMSVSAFAAEEAAHDAGSVSVTGYAAVEGATQYTVMVFEDSFTGTEVEKIFYINQGADPAALLAGMLVKGGELAEGDYTVRIGNDKGTTVDVDLKVVVNEEEDTVTLFYGDVNGDELVNIADGILALRKDAGLIESFEDKDGNAVPEIVGDVNGDGTFNIADAILILRKDAGLIENFTDKDGNVLVSFEYTPAK